MVLIHSLIVSLVNFLAILEESVLIFFIFELGKEIISSRVFVSVFSVEVLNK